MTVTSTTRPDVDLTDGAFYAGDSRPVYRWMREQRAGLPRPQRTGRRVDVSGRDRGRAQPRVVLERRRHPSRPDGVEMMIEMDDPQHLLRRKLVNSGFTRKRVKDQESKIGSLCDTLIDAVCERGECDFVWDLAAPLPMAVIGDMLGVRPEERKMFLKWSDDLVGCVEQHCGRKRISRSPWTPSPAYSEFMMGMIEARKTEPTDDLVSVLVHAEVEGSRLEDHQIVTEILLLLIGGDETTRHTLSGGTGSCCCTPISTGVWSGDLSCCPTRSKRCCAGPRR